jgi:hypothetical protein
VDDGTPAEGPRSGPPAGFRLLTPTNWFDLDLDPKTRTERMAELVDGRIAAEPRLTERRQRLVALLREAARESAESGVDFASVLLEDADGLGMSASASVVAARLVPDAGARPLTEPEAILRSLRSRTEAGGEQLDVGLVELPTGPAVRLQGIRDRPLPESGRSLATVVVQHFVPMPDSELVAVIGCSTPTLVLEASFTSLFDAMARTFTFHWA